jgi:hypothetical protein
MASMYYLLLASFEGAKEYNTIKIKNVDPTVTVVTLLHLKI